MRISFRHGIVAAPSNFINLTGSTVSINLAIPDTLTVAFADGAANYLHQERVSVNNAWAGPFTAGAQSYWLYWDIDVSTGIRTFGHTLLEPIEAATAPVSPANDQHWFDTSTNKTKVWRASSNRWVNRIRLFAAKLDGGAVLVSMGINSPLYNGTQIGLLENVPVNVGPIVFDLAGKPLKHENGTFLTTEDVVTANVSSASRIKIGALWVDAVATEAIPAYAVVNFVDFHQIQLASSALVNPGSYGLVEVAANIGDVVNVVTEGLVSNPSWDWSALGVNAPLYINLSGTLTGTPQPGGVVVASVVDVNTVLIQPSVQTLTTTAPLATTGVAGTVLMATAPANPLAPIVVGTNDTRLTDKVIRAGDTMTGPLILNANPSAALGAATKQYVDTKAPLSHAHDISSVTNLQTQLDLKAPLGYSSTAGYKTLVLGASTFARANVTYTVGGNYQRVSGVVTVQTNVGSLSDPPIAGQIVRIASNNTPDVDITGPVVSVTHLSGTNYSITLADARADKLTATGVGLACTYATTNTHCWPMMMNAYCGGVLDIVNLSVGATFTDEWLEAGRIAEVTSHGPYDIGVLNFGYGNAIQSHTDPASYVVDKIFEALDVYAALCRKCVFVSNFGTTDPAVTPATQKFTLNSRIDAYLKREINRRYPNVSFVDLQSAALAMSTIGASTSAMTNGQPPEGFLDDSDVHYTPYADEIQAKLIARELHRFLPNIVPFASSAVDNIFVNTPLDYDGGTNPNGLTSWDANTVVLDAEIPGSGLLGQIPQGMSLYQDDATLGMTANFTFEDSPVGGKRLRFDFNDPIGSPTGLILGMIYSGRPGATITSLLNNPAFQDKDCDMWCELSWSGFTPEALRAVYFQLVARVGGNQVILAAPICDYGTNAMFSTGATWSSGFSGVVRTQFPFRIPSGVTYTQGQIQFAFRTVENVPLGPLQSTWGRMQLTVRDPLI